MEEERLSANQLDALKEIATIGSATAATALADMVSARVEISVPWASLMPIEKICALLTQRTDRLYIVLDMEIKGDVGGRILLLLAMEDAKFLLSAMLGKNKEEIDFNDELYKSALKEVGNILCGAYVSVLADMTKLVILMSTPGFAMDMVGAVLDFIFIQIAQDSEEALYIKTDLQVKGLSVDGLLLLFPTTASLKNLFGILGVK